MSILDATLPGRLSFVYATDEAVFLRCSADYPELVPEHQAIVAGEDGSFQALDSWTLASPTANFLAAGVQVNQVIYLEDDGDALPPDGAFLAVAGVTQHTLTLRRVGMDSGSGQPPLSGAASGIRFRIATFGPQIELASEDLDRLFRIDERSPFWNPDNIYDIRGLRLACVLRVLVEAYTNQTRSKDSDWSAKRDQSKQELANIESRLAIRWGPLGDTQAPTKRNSVRLIR